MPTVKSIKNSARKILSRNFFIQIGALLFPWVCITSFIYTGVTLASFVPLSVSDMVFNAVIYLVVLFTVAMAFPLVYGYTAFMSKLVSTGNAEFYEMFIAFCSLKLYCRSFRLFFSLIIRFFIVFSVPLCFIYEFTAYTNGIGTWSKLIYCGMDLTYTFLAVLIVFTLTVSTVVFSRFIMACYLTVTHEEKSISDCFFTAKIYTRHCKKHQLRLATSFIPLILLSVASFGILFLYTLPFFFTSLFMFAHERYNDRQLSQNMAKSIFTTLD